MWETLGAVVIGGFVSLIGVWLTNHLSITERRAERSEIWEEQRRTFERTVLMDLSRALTETMRDTTVVHLADINTAKEKGSYGGYLLPVGTDDGHMKRAQELAHLANLVLDDDIRREVTKLRSEMHAIGLGAPRSIEEGESEYLRLIDQYESVQTHVAEAIRSLWAPPARTAR